MKVKALETDLGVEYRSQFTRYKPNGTVGCHVSLNTNFETRYADTLSLSKLSKCFILP